MEDNTQIIFDMAYRYCQKDFENMPCPPISIGKEQEFDAKNAKAHYVSDRKVIEISPKFAHDFLLLNDIKNTIKHELIHAWTHWRGYYPTENNDEWHGEWFLWKAHKVGVDVQYLLADPTRATIWNNILNGWTPQPKNRVNPIITPPPPVLPPQPTVRYLPQYNSVETSLTPTQVIQEKISFVFLILSLLSGLIGSLYVCGGGLLVVIGALNKPVDGSSNVTFVLLVFMVLCSIFGFFGFYNFCRKRH